MAKTAAVTIVTKNNLAFARALLDSLKAVHPRFDLFLGLCDEPEGFFDPAKEPFTVVPASALEIPGFEEMAFRYLPMELCMALKPPMLRHLLERLGYERAFYFDSDIRVYGRLGEAEALLDGGALMVLTPHLTAGLDDGRKPGEIEILRAGTYNMGFLGLARHPSLGNFLSWWDDRLREACEVDLDRGLFVDQKWMDLAPGLFPDVRILRHPGYNVAYWNLAHRRVEKTPDGALRVNGEPLAFFHFSGLSLDAPEKLSTHQNRFLLSDLERVADLVRGYVEVVKQSGHEESRAWPYRYGRGKDRTAIPELLRKLYRETPELKSRTRHDPFGLFPAVGNEPEYPERPEVSRLMFRIWKIRPDLQKVFPLPLGPNLKDFVRWFAEQGSLEYGLDPFFLGPAKASGLLPAPAAARQTGPSPLPSGSSLSGQVEIRNPSPESKIENPESKIESPPRPEPPPPDDGPPATEPVPSLPLSPRPSPLAPLPRTAVFTIVSKNYLAYARALMRSLKTHHPGWAPFVCLCDEPEGLFDASKEPFEVIPAAQAGIPDFKEMAFRYTVLELNTAVKPFFIRRLFERGFDRVVYLDPDILVYSPLTEVEEALAEGALLVLTPHLTGELDDGKFPGEVDILRCGAYNLGFIALGRTADLGRFLRWWETRLARACEVDLERGLFVDQKWIDLAPGLFPGVRVLRHPGYNIAYWNLLHRRVERGREGEYWVEGERLVFGHFSGVSPLNPDDFSKHQNRFRLADVGPHKDLVLAYCKAVVAEGYEHTCGWPYAFQKGPEDVRIPDLLRQLYRGDPDLLAAARLDPWTLVPPRANDPVDEKHPEISRLMFFIWRKRADLRRAFPSPFGIDKESFIHWFGTSGKKEYDLDPYFMASVRKGLRTPADLENIVVRGGLLKFGLTLKKFIPSYRIRRKIRQMLFGSPVERPGALPPPPPPGAAPAPPARVFGANVVGYTRAETGVGESGRLCAESLKAAGVPFSLLRYSVNNVSREADDRAAGHERPDHPHFLNLWHVNADQALIALRHFGPEFRRNRINVGVWHWELPDLPAEWIPAAQALDEVWASSSFIQETVSKASRRPVVKIPHGIRVVLDRPYRRAEFRLPDGPFLFLFMFDILSVYERKNPDGTLLAFEKAFGDRADVRLVVKVNNADRGGADYLAFRQKAKGRPNVQLIEEILERPRVYGLTSVCDALVSLHRSEGFGLGPFEAMALGKPVVATDWSGTRDFVTAETGMPVRYSLVKLDRDHGPYRKGNTWADPDLDHAASCLKDLASDAALRARLSARARALIETEYSPAAAGERIRQRLRFLFDSG